MRQAALALAALCASPWALAHAAEWLQAPAADSVEQPQGWRCLSTVVLPAPGPGRLAVCRRSEPLPQRELELLFVGVSDPPKVLARFGDANQAAMHLFVADGACTAASKAPCIDALILVDQSDESSCYGTQVWVRSPGRDPHSLGFIDEFRPDGDHGQCVGSLARVSAEGADLRIQLPAPLARLRPDGSVRSLGSGEVSYQFSPSHLSLRRAMR